MDHLGVHRKAHGAKGERILLTYDTRSRVAQLTDFKLIDFSDSGQLINVRPIGEQY